MVIGIIINTVFYIGWIEHKIFYFVFKIYNFFIKVLLFPLFYVIVSNLFIDNTNLIDNLLFLHFIILTLQNIFNSIFDFDISYTHKYSKLKNSFILYSYLLGFLKIIILIFYQNSS